jgi:hypothetical protein
MTKTKTDEQTNPPSVLIVDYADRLIVEYPSEEYDWCDMTKQNGMVVTNKDETFTVLIPFTNVFCITEKITKEKSVE